MVEKVMLQLQNILSETNYLNPFYSGFRPRYKMEIALITLLDDWEQAGIGWR